jgi:hypothetical protein
MGNLFSIGHEGLGQIAGGILVTLGLRMTEGFTAFSIPSILAGLIAFNISSEFIS